MNFLKIIPIVLISCSGLCRAQERYCQWDLCNGKKHVACINKNYAFSTDCEPDRRMLDISMYKSLIVHTHNKYRHQIASGYVRRYLPATRMATMFWDDELAYLASLNAKTCKLEHDECRNTVRYKYSGQNLARRWSKPNIFTPRDIVVTAMYSWFNENRDAGMSDINSYQSTSRMIGHFTEMVVERNNRVGCALLRHRPRGGTEYFFACNYASINVIDRPIYKWGPTASKCTRGRNPMYPGLCSQFEQYDMNKW